MDMPRYQKELVNGFNTFDTYDLLRYVRLPDGFAIRTSFKCYQTGKLLRGARFNGGDASVSPLAHAVDGSYVRFRLFWSGHELDVSYACEGGRAAVVEIAPRTRAVKAPAAFFEAVTLWNGPEKAARPPLRAEGEPVNDANNGCTHPCLAVSLTGPALAYTAESAEEARALLMEKRLAYERCLAGRPEAYEALLAAVAWNTVYEPESRRVFTGASRDWNVSNGGYALFCWDTLFAALTASELSRELSYSNFFAAIEKQTADGMLPNTCSGTGFVTLDRSQPPVGARIAEKLYEKFGETDFLQQVFGPLCRWNDWFFRHRRVREGLFAWGSEPYPERTGGEWERNGVGARFGAALESGMDNSPLYDGIPLDETRHILPLADAGLTFLLLADCYALIRIAHILRDETAAARFTARADSILRAVPYLWNEEEGLYLNRRTDTGEFSRRIGATHLYSLYHPGLSRERATRILARLSDEKTFYGAYMVPAISRSDPAYAEQNYWRGRIWPPLNYLVYDALSACPYGAAAAQLLAEKSGALYRAEWREKRHIHENYNAVTGRGCDLPTERAIAGGTGTFDSDCLYGWGALLPYLELLAAR